MRGEKPGGNMSWGNMIGSPPRVRGEGHQARHRRVVYRITPACAGRSSFPAAQRIEKWITPACAGRRDTRRNARKARKDHPRVCGEKYRCALRACSTLGSPPRVRGEDHRETTAVVPIGITPACAGRSGASSR